MSTALPATGYEVRLVTRPEGLPTVENFAVVEAPSPTPAEGEVLVRNLAFRVSASIRMMISEGAEAVEGVPFPALGPGDTLAEQAVGAVVMAGRDSGLKPGDLVSHHLGYREYAAVPLTGLPRLSGDPTDPTHPTHPTDPIVHLGHGWTAYAALTRGVQIRPGDTVFVSGASGAIGSMAGQIACLLGAARVIGSAGSPAKADRLISGLGYDAVVLRGGGSMADQLRAAAPEGIDVVLDAVGGEQLAAAIEVANPGARILVIGALSGQLATSGTGRTAPVELDSVQLLLKKITVRGYSADDDPDALAEWNEKSAQWLRAGEIVFPHARIKGIGNAPQAIVDTIGGRHLGTVVVEI
ncbi:MDR family NADP-dependent oxidoreductase [Catenulispora pinisilvae]|uniref:MDR family NADP-dependent oxidoreductase n=1 Tax=Catenulispora pinisilvae TaxID=2705253 RepID=UPI0018917367|nr:NADP-dependent oxidoreductase [Catenulispora pinisilvae]